MSAGGNLLVESDTEDLALGSTRHLQKQSSPGLSSAGVLGLRCVPVFKRREW
jgi:hypothetical protein